MNRLPKHRRVVNLLRLVWIVLALWHEYFTFSASVRSCQWPSAPTSSSDVVNQPPAHVLLVADPQILDHRSYPGRPPLLTFLSRLIVDLNLRKNWRAAIAKKPDAVVFLGDMMDGGRMDMSDTEYEEYYARFKSIFRTKSHIPQLFIPGNHDIGLQSVSTFSPYARTRYLSHFGPLNDRVSMANHTLILLDAPSFVQEDYERAGHGKSFSAWKPKSGGSFEFVRKVHDENDPNPVVLFTHIPLYRPDGKPCGPLREKGSIRPGVGVGYQNTLGKQSTTYLLDLIRPIAVFSGDDHDYCEHVHNSVIPYPVREITVKSLSMAMNVRRPAFQLLTLFPEPYWDNLHPTYADTPCILPDQLGIYLNVYIPFLVLSLFIVIFAAAVRVRRRHHGRESNGNTLTIEDDDVRYSKSLPGPATSSGQARTSVVCFGRRRRLPLGLGGDCSLLCRDSARSKSLMLKRGFWSNVLHDVRDIAICPIGIFIVITLVVSL